MNKLVLAIIALVTLTAFSQADFSFNVTYLNNQTYEFHNTVNNNVVATATILNDVENGAFTDCDILSCDVKIDLWAKATVNYDTGLKKMFRAYRNKIGRQIGEDINFDGLFKLVNTTKTVTETQSSCTPYTYTMLNGSTYTSQNCSSYDVNVSRTIQEWIKFSENGTIFQGMNNFKLKYSRDIQDSNSYDLFFNIGDTRNLTEFAWWNSSWDHYQTCTINSGVSETLTNFPALCTMNTRILVGNNTMNATGKDLRAIWDYGNGTQIQVPFGIENGTFNMTTTALWVNAPSLSAGNNTNLAIYYGNNLAEDAQNMSGVWMMAKAVVSLLCANNLTNAANASQTMSMTGTTGWFPGQVGSACMFNNTNSYGTLPITYLPTGANAVTISEQVYPYTIGAGALNAYTGYGNIGSANQGLYHAQYNVAPTGRVVAWVGGTDPTISINDNTVVNNWWRFGTAHNGTAIFGYQNGTASTTTVTGVNRNGVYDGNYYVRNVQGTGMSTGAYYVFDNMRVYSEYKTPGWMAAEYNHTTWMSAEVNNTPALALYVNITTPADGNTSLSQNEWFNYTPATGYAIANVTLYSNWSGTWAANVSNTSAVTNNSNNGFFIPGIQAVGFVWNVLLCTPSNGCVFDTSGNHTNKASGAPYVQPTVTLSTPTNAQYITTGSFTFQASSVTGILKNFTLYHNLTGTWSENETFITSTLAKAISTTQNGSFVWNARVCDTTNNCTFANSNYTFQLNFTGAPTTPTSAANSTLSQALSNIVGQGFGYAFGSSIIIGLVILIAILGMLVALKLSFDVILVIMTIAVIGMASFPNATGVYGILPTWFSALIVFLVSGIIFYALMKIFRR